MFDGRVPNWGRPKLFYWTKVAFAAPAGLALLAKLDSRLDFGPALEKIVVNINKISMYVWSNVGDLLNVNIKNSHGMLTFFAMIIIISIKNIQNKNEYYPFILPVSSQIFLMVITPILFRMARFCGMFDSFEFRINIEYLDTGA